MDSNVMKDYEKVRSLYDLDYVSWYMYFENYGMLLYPDDGVIYLIYNSISQYGKTRSLPASRWITWS